MGEVDIGFAQVIQLVQWVGTAAHKKRVATTAEGEREMLYNKDGGAWWLVQYLDPDGVARAWAAGNPIDKDGVRSEAARQLQTYRAKKNAIGDPLGQAAYTQNEELVK